MVKSPAAYHKHMQCFLTLLDDAYVENGRKFDRIYRSGKLVYFVARFDQTVMAKEKITDNCISAGDIFAKKTSVCPNFKRYFGNIANCQKWNWETSPIPLNDSSVVQCRQYGKITHYRKALAESGRVD